MVEVNWDDRYKGKVEDRPWDSGVVEPELMRCFSDELKSKPKRALEIGCGTGTNAIWMAEQGVEVIGTEISPTALDAANAKLAGKAMSVRFVKNDITADGAPVENGTIDLAFDRGVFHIMPPEQRKVFARNVAAALGEDGHWLCLAGSCDERNPAGYGPPRLSLTEIVTAIEPSFEIISVERRHFALPNAAEYAAWRLLMRKR